MSTTTETVIHREVAACREGRHPREVARMPSGWLLFGERQFVPGYLLLLPDPVVPTLNDLEPSKRLQYLFDMSRAGDVLLSLTDAMRINYAIFGNQEPALHAHIVPRYAYESDELRTQHPWAYDWSQAPMFDPVTQYELFDRLRESLAS